MHVTIIRFCIIWFSVIVAVKLKFTFHLNFFFLISIGPSITNFQKLIKLYFGTFDVLLVAVLTLNNVIYRYCSFNYYFLHNDPSECLIPNKVHIVEWPRTKSKLKNGIVKVHIIIIYMNKRPLTILPPDHVAYFIRKCLSNRLPAIKERLKC